MQYATRLDDLGWGWVNRMSQPQQYAEPFSEPYLRASRGAQLHPSAAAPLTDFSDGPSPPPQGPAPPPPSRDSVHPRAGAPGRGGGGRGDGGSGIRLELSWMVLFAFLVILAIYVIHLQSRVAALDGLVRVLMTRTMAPSGFR